MAHQVVRLADQFVVVVAADADERLVAVRDDAARVGRRDERLALGKIDFTPGDGHVDPHRNRLLAHSRRSA